MTERNGTAPPNSLRRLWGYLTHPSPRYSILTIWAVGLAIGVTLWGGFNWAIEASNKEAFCISCHEMRDNVYEELKKTIHYSNRSGVRATCADCHVPREWGNKVIRKIKATNELWGKLTGTIDTREKFEAKRLKLAEYEWRRMKANDSLECRNCHSLESMNTEMQKQRARRQHELAVKNRETCIDCHKGVAHTKPKGMKDED